eukprot:3513990-Lingulodinium_polyedra.AAC.1
MMHNDAAELTIRCFSAVQCGTRARAPRARSSLAPPRHPRPPRRFLDQHMRARGNNVEGDDGLR